MLPPILEGYVVWHPGDGAGRTAADQVVQHFHGTLFSGLIGGAIETYVRSAGWHSIDDAPRPIPLPGSDPPNGVTNAQIIVVVPVLGNELARAVEVESSPWRAYASMIADAQADNPDRVGVFPLSIQRQASDGTELGRIFGRFQQIAAPAAGAPNEPDDELRCRDLSQGIAQLVGQNRLTVFISHTKRATSGENNDVIQLVERVRCIIGQTRLQHFFDANDLQPGGDWDAQLRAGAARSALLALRTDLYASREWCQREMLIAKQEGMPVVILDALCRGEERGSFLMDHVPRKPVRQNCGQWRDVDIRRGLNLLVDECLKRALWRKQAELAQGHSDLGVTWWAPHAPEPATLAHWLRTARSAGAVRGPDPPRILHPDPPLGFDERAVLDDIAALCGLPGIDIMTPRLLAARGG